MEPNNLVVTVVAARGLALKGHSKLDVFASLSLTGPGSWKSKVQTDGRKTSTGDCIWDQRCEFNVNGLDSVLALTVYHRTIIGKTEAVGVVQFPLRSEFSKKGTEWYPLHKKSTLTSSNSDKYRGEVQLKFEFSNKFSTSSMTINTVHEGGKLESLKRKIRFGKKKDKFSEAASIAGFPVHSNRSSLASPELPRNLSRLSFDNDGLIVPPLQSAGSTCNTNSYASPNLVPGDSISSCSRRPSTSSLRPSRTSSPAAVSETDELSAIAASRAQSTTSSGFSSTKSAKVKRPTLFKFREESNCCEELKRMVEEQRIELAYKDARIRDLQDYIDSLISRVIEKDPALLEARRFTCAH